MQQTMLRVGVVGLNARVERVVLPGLARSGRSEVVAVCSRDLTRARSFASPYPGCRAYSRFEEFLADERLEAVFVLTPTEMHEPMSLAAIDAGHHVCCEKPLAGSLAAARRMSRAASLRGVRTAVNFTYRSATGHRLFARELASTGVGELIQADLAYLQARALQGIAADRDPLLELGPHLVDALLWWGEAADAGRPVSITATRHQGAPAWALVARLEAGAVATMRLSRAAPGHRNTMTASFSGRLAGLELTFDVDPFTVRRSSVDITADWQGVATPPDLALTFDEFPAYHFGRIAEALRGTGTFPDFAHAVAVQEVLEAARLSSELDAAVRLPLDS